MYPNSKKPYGQGFDELPFMADYKSFLSWWNAESFFPLDDVQENVEDDLDLPVAA